VVDLARMFRDCALPFRAAAIKIFAFAFSAAAPLATTESDLFTWAVAYFPRPNSCLRYDRNLQARAGGTLTELEAYR
jgi:hypothetical protein